MSGISKDSETPNIENMKRSLDKEIKRNPISTFAPGNEETETVSKQNEETETISKIQDIRPKRRKKIEYITVNDPTPKQGIVTHVGKASGKEKNRCLIKSDNGEVESLDFETD